VKQIAQYQDGRLELQEVPQPTPPPAGILLRTTHRHQHRARENESRAGPHEPAPKARARPDQGPKSSDSARSLGWRAALEKVRNDSKNADAAGLQRGGGGRGGLIPANTRFPRGRPGRLRWRGVRVSRGFLAVPDLLAAPVPAGVDNWEAAYTTLCAIALQAVRQTEARLGERVLVMGQGLVGLLVTNFLQAAGARVMAVDLAPSRRLLCPAMGAERTVILGEQNLSDEARAWTEGFGVDAAVICTATPSNAPIEQAAEVIRDAAAGGCGQHPGRTCLEDFLRKRARGAVFPFLRSGALRSGLTSGQD